MELVFVGDDFYSGLDFLFAVQAVVAFQIVHDVLVIRISDSGTGTHPAHILHDILSIGKDVLTDGALQDGVIPENHQAVVDGLVDHVLIVPFQKLPNL